VRIDQPLGSEDLPSDQISRIEVRKIRRYSENILGAAAAPLVLAIFACADSTHGAPCVIGYTAVFSPIWAYAAVSAPFYLAADGVSLFRPPKVYVLVH
jgi:hypothetical protein